MRIERIVLEHHRDIAIHGFLVVGPFTINEHLTSGDRLQPRHHAQKRRLSTPGRADNDDEFSIGDVGCDAMDHIRGAKAFLDIL
jgi:hypothetical protein